MCRLSLAETCTGRAAGLTWLAPRVRSGPGGQRQMGSRSGQDVAERCSQSGSGRWSGIACACAHRVNLTGDERNQA